MDELVRQFGEVVQDLRASVNALASERRATTASTSSVNVNGGGWLNTAALIVVIVLALTAFLQFQDDRHIREKEVEDIKKQVSIDVQRMQKNVDRQAEKLETHDAYINDIYRRKAK